MKKCETCGSYIITQEDIEGLQMSSCGHSDPVGEPGISGVDGVHDVILEPRRLGHWTAETDEEEPNPMFKHVVCSVCGGTSGTTFKYCPCCGAKMFKE